MTLILLSNPVKTINGMVSNANGAKSQLPYTFQRQDETFLSVTNGGAGFSNIQLPDTSLFSVGDRIFVNSVLDRFTGEWIISAIAVNVSITIPATFGATDSGLINNLTTIENYKVNIQILDSSDNPLIPIVFKYSPKPDGNLFVDVGRILEDILRSQQTNSLLYKLSYQETYTGFEGSIIIDAEVQAVLAERQLLELGGSNMWRYILRRGQLDALNVPLSTNAQNEGNVRLNAVANTGDLSASFIVGRGVRVLGTVTYPDADYILLDIAYDGINDRNTFLIDEPWNGFPLLNGTISPDLQGRILTTFKNPLTWIGWKRTVSILIDGDYLNRNGSSELQYGYNSADINFGNISLTTVEVVDSTPARIFESIMPETLKDQFFLRARITFFSGTAVGLPVIYKVLTECRQPIMLEWRNSLGVFEQHLFTLDTIFNNTVTEGLTGQASIEEDIEFVSKTEGRIPLFTTQEAILTEENLLIDQLEALIEIKSSDQVRVWLDKTGVNFIDVIVNNLFSTEANNENTSFDISVQIKFPNNFKFNKGKLY